MRAASTLQFRDAGGRIKLFIERRVAGLPESSGQRLSMPIGSFWIGGKATDGSHTRLRGEGNYPQSYCDSQTGALH